MDVIRFPTVSIAVVVSHIRTIYARIKSWLLFIYYNNKFAYIFLRQIKIVLWPILLITSGFIIFGCRSCCCLRALYILTISGHTMNQTGLCWISKIATQIYASFLSNSHLSNALYAQSNNKKPCREQHICVITIRCIIKNRIYYIQSNEVLHLCLCLCLIFLWWWMDMLQLTCGCTRKWNVQYYEPQNWSSDHQIRWQCLDTTIIRLFVRPVIAEKLIFLLPNRCAGSSSTLNIGANKLRFHVSFHCSLKRCSRSVLYGSIPTARTAHILFFSSRPFNALNNNNMRI